MKKILRDTPFVVVDMNSGRYVIEQTGHELYNLEKNKIDGRYYGYCPPHDGVNIQTLGAKHDNESIDNVMVIYVQKLPDSNNRQIIAFSDNVTAYKNKQFKPSLKRQIRTNTEIIECSFSIESDYMYDLRDYKEKFTINIAKYNTYMFRQQRFYKGTYLDLDEEILDFLEKYLYSLELTDDTSFQEDIQKENTSKAKALSSDSTDELSYTTGANGYQIAKKSRIAKAALIKAKFKCTINDKHITFKTPRGDIYMEGHHLIPCTCTNAGYFKNKFNINIDCIENIVSLCPTCHRLVHFGSAKERNELLKKLYFHQIDDLKKIGIELSLNDLLKLYER